LFRSLLIGYKGVVSVEITVLLQSFKRLLRCYGTISNNYWTQQVFLLVLIKVTILLPTITTGLKKIGRVIFMFIAYYAFSSVYVL